MLLKPLTIAAGLLALPAAQAFLIPPEISDADIQIANTIDAIHPHVDTNQVVPVDIECPDCPVLLGSRRGKAAIQLKIDRPSHLSLVFVIDNQPDHDRLLVNGFELYPSSSLLTSTLWAPQFVDRKHKEKDERHHHEGGRRKFRHHKFTPQPQRLGFGLRVSPPKKDTDGQFELVELELQIIEVGAVFVDGIPSITVKLIKDREGRLLMTQIEKSRPETPAALPSSAGAEECTTTLCEWLAMAREKFNKLKGFGHCHGAVKGAPASDEVPAHHQPQHAGADDHWRATYQERHWGKLFKHMASHILLPVLIGIVAGVTVSIIGMVVGTVLVSLWRALFRRRSGSAGHRRRRSSHAHRRRLSRKESALAEDEKAGLMEYQDEAPQDAPPSYEEAETVKTSQV
ncbi:hypothetical protein P885DRAFT_59204 [Corynascus similis CBS 632.67]